MKIRTKISVLVSTLILAVVGAVAASVISLEGQRLSEDYAGKIDALMDGVQRLARESLRTKDELMLLSYLMLLRRDYPLIEVAVVSRAGHSSLLGEVKTELFYKTVTVTERSAAELKSVTPLAASLSGKALPPTAGLPPQTFSVQLGFSKSELNRQIAQARKVLARRVLSIAALSMLLALAGAAWLGGLLARPVTQLAAAAKSLGEGQLDTAVETRSSDEIGDLARQFNLMAARLRDLVRFKEDVLSTLSHELNNPLGGLKGFLEFLEQRPDEDSSSRREAFKTMTQAVSQMEISLRNALEFARTSQPALKPQTLALGEHLESVVKLFQPLARTNGIELSGPEGPAKTTLFADEEMIRRVFMNLISNALKYTPPGGKISVSYARRGKEITVSVADTGPGVAAEDRQAIFTKFYRGKDVSGPRRRIPGSGLGLAIAKQIVELHKGEIWVEKGTENGSIFNVKIINNT